MFVFAENKAILKNHVTMLINQQSTRVETFLKTQAQAPLPFTINYLML